MKLTKKRIITLTLPALVFIATWGALFWSTGQNVQEPTCEVRRSAVDLGSGSTKLLIADIDSCTQSLIRVVHSESQKVDYKQSLLDYEQMFSPEVRKEGLEVLKKYLGKTKELGAEKPLVVSTAAFREARNSEAFLEAVRTQLGLDVNIIDQSTEAKLGYLSVLASKRLEPENTIVWDIGGGSQQISYFSEGEIQGLLMNWGSISYKAKVLEALHREGISPNPLTWEEVLLVKPLASTEVQWPAPFKTVVGVGGVFSKSLGPKMEVQGSKFHRLDLEDLLSKSYFLTDNQLGGSYPETDVTNIIMVLSLMEQFGVDEILVAETGLLEGALVYGLKGLRADK